MNCELKYDKTKIYGAVTNPISKDLYELPY